MLEPLESRRMLHSASLVDGVLRLEGVDGENDQLVITKVGSVYRAQALNDGFTQEFDAALVRMVEVEGKSGDDSITLVDVDVRALLEGDEGNDTISGGLKRDTIDGGEGDDVLQGNGDRDLLLGEDGNDTLSGGGRNDTLVGDSGADFFVGGPGALDLVTYQSETSAVSVTIDDIANDGEAGENDNIAATCEAFWGGDGADFIRGSGKNNNILGGAGNDTLLGGGGNDTIQGNGGSDSIEGHGGNDLLFAAGETGGDVGTDIDTLIGGSGTDTASGGGEDTILSVP